MTYLFCKCKSSDNKWLELDFSNRSDVIRWLESKIVDFQTFAVSESGNIFGYAVELSYENKPTAILYPYSSQLIWIDMGLATGKPLLD